MMHSRNIYNKPPDFDKLSKDYPEFAKISQLVSVRFYFLGGFYTISMILL